jgi:hypothetical protein
MKISIMSEHGHHEAVVEDEVSREIFNKLTGKSSKALPAEMKVKVPNTFQELSALWHDGGRTYLAVGKRGGESVKLAEYDPKADEVLFMPPQAGG